MRLDPRCCKVSWMNSQHTTSEGTGTEISLDDDSFDLQQYKGTKEAQHGHSQIHPADRREPPRGPPIERLRDVGDRHRQAPPRSAGRRADRERRERHGGRGRDDPRRAVVRPGAARRIQLGAGLALVCRQHDQRRAAALLPPARAGDQPRRRAGEARPGAAPADRQVNHLLSIVA